MSLFLVNDLIYVKNSYEISVGYFLLVAPLNLILMAISFSSKKNDAGWRRKISLIGIGIALLSLFVGGFVTVYRLIDYYFLAVFK